jgi:hypothetical protein
LRDERNIERRALTALRRMYTGPEPIGDAELLRWSGTVADDVLSAQRGIGVATREWIRTRVPFTGPIVVGVREWDEGWMAGWNAAFDEMERLLDDLMRPMNTASYAGQKRHAVERHGAPEDVGGV